MEQQKKEQKKEEEKEQEKEKPPNWVKDSIQEHKKEERELKKELERKKLKWKKGEKEQFLEGIRDFGEKLKKLEKKPTAPEPFIPKKLKKVLSIKNKLEKSFYKWDKDDRLKEKILKFRSLSKSSSRRSYLLEKIEDLWNQREKALKETETEEELKTIEVKEKYLRKLKQLQAPNQTLNETIALLLKTSWIPPKENEEIVHYCKRLDNLEKSHKQIALHIKRNFNIDRSARTIGKWINNQSRPR